MLGSPVLYLKGMRILMFQLSGFYCRGLGFLVGCLVLRREWGEWSMKTIIGDYIGTTIWVVVKSQVPFWVP